MQDAYVGDIGDFGKLTLLDHLAKDTGLSVGVVWHLVCEPARTNDGRHRSYLDANLEPDPKLVRSCNPQLFDKFTELGFFRPVGHRVSMLQEIFTDFTYFGELCHKTPGGEFKSRLDWIARARKHLAGSELIFFDPDNGIRFGKNKKALRKHVHEDELRAFWEDGKSLLIYHHLGRAKHEVDIAEIQNKLAITCGISASDIFDFHFRRGTGRVYYFVPNPNSNRIRHAVETAKAKLEPLLWPLADWRKKHMQRI